MYVQERDGKFRFFESYLDPRTRERKTASVTLDRNTAKSRIRAQNLLNARISKLTAQPDKSPAMPLKDLTEAYIRYQAAHVQPQTVIGDKNALKAILEILGGDTDIRSIDARYITERLDATGETPTRKNYRLKHVKKLFRWAYLYNYMNSNITDKLIRYKDSQKARREFKYMEADELKAVLDAIKIEKYKNLTEFLALSGLRIGEALAITKDDIDLEQRTIRVNKALSLVTYEIGSTKTEESDRTIHIQTEMLPVVMRILPCCFKDIQYAAYNKFLKETTKRVIGRPLSPHSLRHTHVSLLAASGVDLSVIARRCGHHDSDVTRDIYLHVTSQMKDRDAAILDSIRIM